MFRENGVPIENNPAVPWVMVVFPSQTGKIKAIRGGYVNLSIGCLLFSDSGIIVMARR